MVQLSVWEKESFMAPADILITGSGFVGLWSAYYLKKKHPALSITVVDRGVIPTGASTRNAGFACFGSLTELVADAQAMGEDQMLALVEMRYRGIRKIGKVFPAKSICLEQYGGYELISESQGLDINTLRSHMDWLNRKLKKIIKLQKAFRSEQEKLRDFGFAGVQYLIGNKAEAQLHSGKLCQSLLQLVRSMGVNVLNGIEVVSFEKVNGRLLLHTGQGFTMSAGQLLICTNGFAKQLLPQLDIQPARGQVLVTSPIAKLPFKGTFHFDEGYYYFRDLGDRILLGGARNKAFEEEGTEDMDVTTLIQQELERFLRETLIPDQSFTIEHRWSGVMGMGSEKLPIVKQINDQVFCAVRMSGMGVALAPVIGAQVAEMMINRS